MQMVIARANGSLMATVGRLQRAMLDHPDYGPIILNHAPVGPGQFHGQYNPPQGCTVIGPGGVVGEVVRIFIDIKTRGLHAPVKARSALHQDRVTTLAEAEMPDGTLSVVVREFTEKEPSITATHKTRATP